MANLSKRLVQRILQELHSETLPYSPLIYPPPQAWDKTDNDILLRNSWREISKIKNAPVDLYVHIPFCASVCNFCGMNSKLLDDPCRIDEYLNALNAEASIIGGLLSPKKISSVRVGGGTPSLLSESQIRKLFGFLFDIFKFERNQFGNNPISIVFEASPYSLDIGKLGVLKENGVNGLALGVQSLDDKVLRRSGRLQTKAEVREVIKNARQAKFDYVSVDLMCGLEGQTEKSFLNDVETMIKWGADRIVLYGFSPTKHTRFAKEGGIITEKRRKEISRVVEKGIGIIQNKGYKSDADETEVNSGIRDYPGRGIYEGSYLAYGEQDEKGRWHSVAGLGLGSMSVIVDKARYGNHRSLKAYMNSLKRGRLPAETGVKLTLKMKMINHIMRIIDDRVISIKKFKRKFGEDIKEKFSNQLRHLVSRGIIRERGGNYEIGRIMNGENLIFEISHAFFEEKILKKLQAKYALSDSDAAFRPVSNELEPNIFLTDKCNQQCLFCSSVGEDRLQNEKEINYCVLNSKDTISIEGGEPTLSRDLSRWVRFAKNKGVKEIILCTNGATFSDKKSVLSLVRDGVTLFNVNFPSHIEKIFNALTQTKGLFKKRLENLGRLFKCAGGERVRFTFVINKLNYLTMRAYAEFIKDRFPGVSYIEFNMIKIKGSVKKRTYLVPRLSEIAPYLRSALKFCADNGVKCLVDGMPVCLIKEFKEASIEAFKLDAGDYTYMNEKTKPARCKGCALGKICAGPRKDYVDMYGDCELKPVLSGSRKY